ncbi:DUF4271 domain-containing protein [Parapedobacter deserti]|uniref:DUF4271 domain-containing protein n=1 Tax=Parapedobacter deserti TaxID=1912957 RepID=A0ABV7JK48_9SPHI
MKYFLLLVVAVLPWCVATPLHVAIAFPAQQQAPETRPYDANGQARLAENKRAADSIRQIQDSLSMQYISLPDPNRPNQFADSLRELLVVEKGDFMRWLTFAHSLENQHEFDEEKASREPWVIAVIGLLLLFFGIVKVSFPNEVASIIQAFYNDRMLLQINKEDTLYSSWPFVFLYILFGFAVGLFIYLLEHYYLSKGSSGGIEAFMGISMFVMLLFSLKIITTRFLGFVFDLQRVVREYVSILYLSYFNAALVFLPIVLVLSFVPRSDMSWVVPLTLLIVFCLFVFRFVKTASNVLTNHRFSKFYLFMYLCCLEIAPILILVKVFGD